MHVSMLTCYGVCVSARPRVYMYARVCAVMVCMQVHAYM